MRFITTHNMGVCWCRAALVAALMLSGGGVGADTRVFTHRTADGVMVFSDAPVGKDGSLVRRSYRSTTRPVVNARFCRGLNNQQLGDKERDLDVQIDRAAAQYSLDHALIKAVARAESCFDPSAVSRAGARGIMQLMPETAAELGVTDIHDLKQNLNGGAKYLAQMLRRYSSDTQLALAAYNAGPGNVDRYQGIPPFPETRQYIKTVLRYQTHYSNLGKSH